MSDKPVVKGPVNGNALSVMGAVTTALKRAGQGHLVDEYRAKATSGDYHHLLAVSMDYVDFDLSPDDVTDRDPDDLEEYNRNEQDDYRNEE